MGDSFSTTRTTGRSGVRNDPGQNTPNTHGLSRRGSGLVLPEMQDQVWNGNVHIINLGTATTPINFAKTAYDADQPQFVIDVPSGTTIMPLKLSVFLETSAGTLNEIIWGAANANVGAGTSTAITIAAGTRRNLLINASGTEPTSVCPVYSLYTGNGTDVTSATAYDEFARFGYAFADTTLGPHKRYVWDYLADGPAPVIEGTGSLVCWIDGASTAPTGYITAVYLELATS